MLSRLIIRIIDWFYPIFKRLMPLQTFRYAACGGGNTLLSLFVYSASYNFLFRKKPVDVYIHTFEPYVAAMMLAFALTVPLGFYMARNVVFSSSTLRGRHQLVRYLTTALLSLGLNWINLKILVKYCHIYPTPAQIINTIMVISFSYVMQRHFAFTKKTTLSK